MANSSSSIWKNWVVISTIVVIISAMIGLYLYNNTFRQAHADLIETVPTDANYIFQVNDNRSYVKDATPLLPYLVEIFNMSSFAGFEFFLDQLHGYNNPFIISGHRNGDKQSLLYSFKVPERSFDQLLKKLNIDPRNFKSFASDKIYTYGTHYKRFYFVFQNGIFSISEDQDLLKNSILQLKSMKNLLGNRYFNQIYEIVLKNTKQNWLIINNKTFFATLQKGLKPEYQRIANSSNPTPSWAAYQVRFESDEIHLSGYVTVDQAFTDALKTQERFSQDYPHILPFNTHFYTHFNILNLPDFLKIFENQNSYKESIENYKLLQPTSATDFFLMQDTTVYHYIAFQCDTAHTSIASLLDEDSLTNSKTVFKNIPIYHSKLSTIVPHFNKRFRPIELSYFIQYDNFYLFANSIEALSHYLKVIAHNNIESNPYFRFTKANLPSENCFEYYLATSPDRSIGSYLMQDYVTSEVAKHLKLVSYSHSVIQDQLLSVNAFIKF